MEGDKDAWTVLEASSPLTHEPDNSEEVTSASHLTSFLRGRARARRRYYAD